MTTVISFAEWKQDKEDLKIDCMECDGDGYVECEYGHEHDCPDCNGAGYHTDITVTEYNYFMSIVKDIRRVCVWTNRDFLGEVGTFVRHYRSNPELYHNTDSKTVTAEQIQQVG